MKTSIVIFLFTWMLLCPLLGQSGDTLSDAWLSSLERSPASVDSLNEVAWDFRKKDRAKALEYAQLANTWAMALNYKKGEADSHARLGIIAKGNGDLEAAETHYQKALELREEIGYLPDIAGMYVNLGAVQESRGNIRQAIQTFEKGIALLEISSQDDDALKSAKANLHNSVGDSYQKVGQYDMARNHLERSLEIRKELNDEAGLAESYLNLGVLYVQVESLDTVEGGACLREALRLYEKLENAAGQGKCWLNLGSLYFNQEKIDSAEVFYDKALQTGGLNQIDSLKAFRNKGSIYFQRKQYDEALKIYLEALDKFKAVNEQAEMAALYSDIGNVYLVQGKYLKSIEALNASRKLSDSLKLYQTKMTAANSLSLAHQLRARRQVTLAFGSLSGIIIIASLIVYSNRKKLQIAEQKEELANRKIDDLLLGQEVESTRGRLEGQEIERDRIAKDLHDRIGMMLSTIKLYFDEPTQSQAGGVQPEALDRYNTAKNLLDEACQEVRRVSHDLASPLLINQGLEVQLQEMAKRIEEAIPTKVNIQAHGMKKRLNSLIELRVYPIIQSIIGNVLKHAKATIINIQLNHFEDQLNIVIEDNGRGFDPKAAMATNTGMGLQSIAVRVDELKGTFDIDSGLGKGATFFIDIPLEDVE